MHLYIYNAVLQFDVCLPVEYKMTISGCRTLSSFCRPRKGLPLPRLVLLRNFKNRNHLQQYEWESCGTLSLDSLVLLLMCS